MPDAALDAILGWRRGQYLLTGFYDPEVVGERRMLREDPAGVHPGDVHGLAIDAEGGLLTYLTLKQPQGLGGCTYGDPNRPSFPCEEVHGRSWQEGIVDADSIPADATWEAARFVTALAAARLARNPVCGPLVQLVTGDLDPEVVVAGCGSTGGAVLLPLLRTGAEHFVLLDPGDYELNNLNRQDATLADLGRNKATVSAERLLAVNPHAQVDAVDVTTQAGVDAKLALHDAAAAQRVRVLTAYDIAATQFIEIFDYSKVRKPLAGRVRKGVRPRGGAAQPDPAPGAAAEDLPGAPRTAPGPRARLSTARHDLDPAGRGCRGHPPPPGRREACQAPPAGRPRRPGEATVAPGGRSPPKGRGARQPLAVAAMSERVKGLVLADGANEFGGLLALLQAGLRWPGLRRAMTHAAGYVGHRLWYGFPYTVGLLTGWEDEASAYRFAHLPAHLEFGEWATIPGKTGGGWLAFYSYDHGGPLWGNGVRKQVGRFGRFTAAPSGEPPQGTPRQRRQERKRS